jgi:ribosomal protein L16/L10AE
LKITVSAIAKEALRLASGKLPLKTKIVSKADTQQNEAGGESK